MQCGIAEMPNRLLRMVSGMSARDLVRVGIVSSVDPAKATVRVTFPDNDNLVSGELRILNRGGVKNRDYWLPDVDDEVVCIFPTNDANYCDGFIVGALFNEKSPPNASSQDVFRLDFGDGSFVQFDRSSGALEINCKGNVTIKGAKINLN